MPHYQPENGVLFITFRLNNSLPADFIAKLNEYKLEISSKTKQGSYYQNVIRKRVFDFYDTLLTEYRKDTDYLTNPGVAEIIMNTLQKFDKDLYDLFCFTIMPNHVHILLRLKEREEGEYHQLSFIVKKIKSITTHDINLLLKKTGSTWQREYYDYCARSGKEAMNIANYILMNPVKAKLVNEPEEWKYSWISDEF